jgi:prepilin-type N-terminal cleavage/methylation domain-containing protein
MEVTAEFSRVSPGADLPASHRPRRAFTLVEIMVAMLLLASVLVGFLAALIQSRRVTEGSVMHAAATSLVYGLIEQMKGLDYTTLLPSGAVDPAAPSGSAPPYVRLRVNQDLTIWLRAVYTTAGHTPAAPSSTPAPDATVASMGNPPTNVIGPLPLSTTAGTRSQQLTLQAWLWIDEIPDRDRDVVEVKKITLVYRYYFNDGRTIRPVIDREVFIRTRFDA